MFLLGKASIECQILRQENHSHQTDCGPLYIKIVFTLANSNIECWLFLQKIIVIEWKIKNHNSNIVIGGHYE